MTCGCLLRKPWTIRLYFPVCIWGFFLPYLYKSAEFTVSSAYSCCYVEGILHLWFFLDFWNLLFASWRYFYYLKLSLDTYRLGGLIVVREWSGVCAACPLYQNVPFIFPTSLVFPPDLSLDHWTQYSPLYFNLPIALTSMSINRGFSF